MLAGVARSIRSSRLPEGETDLTTQTPAIVAVKNRYLKPPFSAWTAIQVARLIPTIGITDKNRGKGFEMMHAEHQRSQLRV